MQALIDSGASGIIFNFPKDTAQRLFDLSHLGDTKILGLTGEGGAEIFRIKHFQFADFEFVDIPIIVLKQNIPKIPPIVIGSGVFGPMAHKEEDYEHNILRITVPEYVLLTKKVWIRRKNGEWKTLDYQNGEWIAMSSSLMQSQS